MCERETTYVAFQSWKAKTNFRVASKWVLCKLCTKLTQEGVNMQPWQVENSTQICELVQG